MSYELKGKHIVVTGGSGFLGSYVVERLLDSGAQRENIKIPRSKKYDLRNFDSCLKVTEGTDIIIHLAANVGGIGYNMNYPADLFYDNAVMGINVIHSAMVNKVGKLVVTGTVCSYPKHTPVPFKEADLWNGFPEETNAPYGIAKKILLTQAETYRKQYGMNIIYLIPVNLYGPGDHFEPERSHVIPALIKKFIEARDKELPEVEVWGTGEASREFLFVDDAAKGIVEATLRYNKPEPVNLGTGSEIRIRDLAYLIKDITGYDGELVWNTDKPDGQPRRMLDTSLAEREFGFKAGMKLSEGIRRTVEWYETAFRS